MRLCRWEGEQGLLPLQGAKTPGMEIWNTFFRRLKGVMKGCVCVSEHVVKVIACVSAY